jgi:hypothetical protein
MTLLDVQNLPKVVQDSRTDTHEGEQSDHLAAEGARQRSTSRQEPEPPGASKLSVSLLVELDVTKDGERHEQDQSGVKEDQSGLDDMSIVCLSVRGGDKGVKD